MRSFNEWSFALAKRTRRNDEVASFFASAKKGAQVLTYPQPQPFIPTHPRRPTRLRRRHHRHRLRLTPAGLRCP